MVDYSSLTPILVGATNELNEKIKIQENELESKKKINSKVN